VSNEPETLTGANIQVYKCEIPLVADTPQRIRVFVWHVAQSGGNTFHIALRLGAGTGSVSSFVGQVEEVTVGNSGTAGICCAEALLYNSYDVSFDEYALSTTEAVVYTRAIASAKLLGAVLEFDVEANTATTLYFRTYVGTVSESTSPPTGEVPRHVRGWWPYSEATFPVSGNLDTNTAATTPGVLWCPIEETYNSSGSKITPPELVEGVFGHRNSDTHGWLRPNEPDKNYPLGGNVGLYGAVVKYDFTVSNSHTSNQHAAYMEIFGRNTGEFDKVFGAAQIIVPSGYPQWIVPPLGFDEDSGLADGRKLTEKSTGNAAILVPPNTASQPVTVRFTAAGASGLPGNLLLKALRDPPP
jgi:hypothetical protein